LALSEVSDASDIIHSSAHEEANIIFGAVIDPAMEGRVKITVIATGFDRARTAISPAAQATIHTPVDLNAYTMRPHEEPLVASGGMSGGRIAVSRRPLIDLPSFSAVAPADRHMVSDADDEIEETSPLDVPAFLRRQEG